MAIGSKKSLGKNSMYVQAKRGGKSSSRRKSGSTSLKSTGKSSKSSGDQDAIDTNAGNDFYSKFKDTSLESQLIQRGFSSMRPEIVGAFEFIPPLSSDTEDVSQKEGQVVYDTTSSGELVDMQTQLKALRCQQTMRFLTKTIGLKSKWGRGTGIRWNQGASPFTHTLWKPFYFQMSAAKSVLNFLSAALLLTDFGRVTDIKLNRYLTVRKAGGRQWDLTGKTRARSGIATRLKAYRGEFIKNKAPGKMSLNEYLTTFLQYPEDYLTNVSSSALMMQLLADAAARMIYPKTSFSNISTPSGQFGPMCLPGVSFEKNRDYRVTSQLSQLSETIKIIGEASEPMFNARETRSNPLLAGLKAPTENPLLETEETGTDYYTKGDFFELWTILNDRKNPKPIYIAARDFMNHCAQTQLSQESGMPTRTSTKNTLKSLLGFNPFTSYDNIADIPTSPGDVLGLNAFRKSIGDNTVVATFNEGWGDTESGDTSAVTGQSYFVDDFFKNGESGVKEGVKRFSDLKESLKAVKGKLFRFSKQRITPKTGLGESFKNTYIGTAAGMSIMKYQSDYSGPDVPGIKLVGQTASGDTYGRKSLEGAGTFFQRIWSKITQGIYLNYGSRTGPNPSGNIQDSSDEGWYGEAVQYQVFMAAALDRDVAWAAFRYYLAYQNKILRGSGTGAQTADDAAARLSNESRLLADEIWRFYGLDEKIQQSQSIKFYGFGYDSDEAPLDLNDSVEGVPSPWGFAQSPSWCGLNSQRSIDEVDGGERLRTDYAGAWKDSFLRPGNDWADKKDFVGVLDGSRSNVLGSEQPLTIFKDITEAVEEWESVMIAEYGVGDRVKKGAKTGDLKIDMWGRVIVGYMISLVIFRECLTLCHVRPTWASISQASARNSHLISFGYSRRAVNSVGYSRWLYNKRQTTREEMLADDRFGPITFGTWTPGMYSTNSDGLVGTTGAPSGDAVRDVLDIFYTYHIPLIEWDVLVWNNLYYITEICDSVISVINKIASTFSDAGSNDLISEMKKIQADPDLGDQLFDMITPEQARLSRYIYDSLSSENRKYPYLPASSGIVPNSSKNLGTISRLPIFLDTDGIQDKRIFVIGLPAGLVEFLRRSASRSLVSSDFNTSSIVKLSVWRRNLLTETTAQLPVEYLFDVKRFMLDGRRSAPKSFSGTKGIGARHDSAWKYFPGQTLDDLFKNARICRYTDSGLGSIYAGTAYSDKALNAAKENGSLSALSDKILPTCINYAGKSETILDEIFYNHVVDHYLKLYLKLTSGIDVREEVFCFQNDKTQIIGPDENKEVLRKEWEEKLRALFDTRDMASSLTYQRMLGELDRSIFLSPKKYKNRIIYPKIFDRVFCIYIDESMWKDDVPESNESTNIETGQNAYENVSSESEATILSLGSADSPTYYQYYVTVSIISELANES